MATNEKQNTHLLKIIFRTLPVLGAMAILFGIGHILYKKQVNLLEDSAYIGVGVLLFLTVFVKAEVANLKYYLHVFTYSVFVLAICVVAYMFARQYTKSYDLTKNRQFSLSEQSAKVVRNLKDPVEIVVFTPVSAWFKSIEDLYGAGGGKLKWTYMDARKDPLEIAKYARNGEKISNGTILIKSGKRQKQLQATDLINPQSGAANPEAENSLTNALIEVTRDKDVKVYFTKGHGELAFESGANPSMMRRPSRSQSSPTVAQFRKYLGDKAMQTAELELVNGVPQDAALVVVAGLQTDLTDNEVQALDAYLGRDGKIMVTVDVPMESMVAPQPLTNLKKLLNKYGVDIPDKIVLDLLGQRAARSVAKPIITWLNPDSPITADYAPQVAYMAMALDGARPIVPGANPGGYKVAELAKSSPQSWAADLSVIASGHASPPAERSAQPLVVSVSQAPPPSQPGMPPPPDVKGGMRMVVAGSSELIEDSLQKTSNLAVALMTNSVNWLTQQEDLIAIAPRQVPGTPLSLDTGQMTMIFLLAVLVIPAIVFFGGLTYTLLRRAR